MFLDLAILTLAVCSFKYSYNETNLFAFMKRWTGKMNKILLLFLVSLVLSTVYFFVPLLVPFVYAAAAAYIVLIVVLLFNWLREG